MDADPLGSGEQLVGRTIGGKFTIEAHLGGGAMGAVYRARQIALDKIVAVKVLHRKLTSDARFVDSFQREAYAASLLDHPNSMRVLDFGKEPDGLLYIAMELVAGRNLLEVLEDEWPLPQARIVDIVSQILAALAVAHEMGVLHRDLKPENVMLVQGRSDDGQRVDVIKVCDFGIAKIGWNQDQDDEATPAMLRRAKLSMSVVVGTPSYMSPEQARGEPVDASTDLYSIGVLLYQLITGQLPFEGTSTMAVLLRHAHEPPQPPHLLVPHVNRKLEAVCLKAMEKNQKDRYASARAMRADLRAIAHAFAAASLADTLTEPVQLDLRTRATLWRHGPRARAAAVAVVVALAAAGLGAWLARPAPRLAPPTASQSAVDVAEPQPPSAAIVMTSTAHAPVPRGEVLALRRARSQSYLAPPRPSVTAATETVEPAPPTPAAPVLAIPTPSPAPSPSPSPPVVRVVPPAPRVDPEAASVSTGSPSSPRGTTPASVTKIVLPLAPRFTDCYRAALRRNPTPGAEGAATLHLETDDDGVIVEARYRGPLAPALGACMAAAVRGRKLPNVDTGSASADIPLTLRLR